MNFKSLTVILLGAALPLATQADSLGRIYELALKNDYQLQRAEATYNADSELSEIARAELLPKIKADFLFKSVSEDSKTRQLITPEDGGLLEVDVALEREVDDKGWLLRLDQPIFDASAWYGYKQGKAKALVASAVYANARQEVLLRVLTVYFDVLRAQDNLSAARAQERAFAFQLEQIKTRFNSGLIAVNEVAESQSAYDLASIRTIEEMNEVEMSLEVLSNMTGQRHTIINILREDFISTSPEPDNIKDWSEATSSDNLLLLAARHAETAAQENSKAADWEHAPTLKLGVFASSVKTSGTVYSNVVSPFILAPDRSVDNIGVELRLEIPLFEGGATSANSRRAAYQFQASRDLVSETNRTVVTQARQLFLKVKSDITRIEMRRQSILSAKSAFDAADAGYKIGTRNIIDVLNAQNILFATERDYANSRYDYIENSFRLRAVAARLRPGDLYRLDAFLYPPSNKQTDQRSVR
jgi:outer membrane protein